MATRYDADVLRTRRPVMMLVRNPQTTVGRKRREVWSGERVWISWKLGHASAGYVNITDVRSSDNYWGGMRGSTYNKVVKYPNGLNAPQVRKTTIHVVVNADCFQIEFGMMAGRLRCSCLCIQ